jgi:hypothetical protein
MFLVLLENVKRVGFCGSECFANFTLKVWDILNFEYYLEGGVSLVTNSHLGQWHMPH